TSIVPGLPAYGTTGGAYGGWAEDDTWGGVMSPWGILSIGKNTLYYTDGIDISALGVPAAGESYRAWDANAFGTFNLLDAVPVIVNGVAMGSRYTLGNTRSQNVVKYTSKKIGPVDFGLAWSKNPYNSELQSY